MSKEADPHGSQFWRCLTCGHKTSRKDNMTRHVETKHTQMPGFVCNICCIVCPSKSALSMHYFRKHKNSNAQETWYCLKLNIIMSDWINLSAAVETYVSRAMGDNGSSLWRCVGCGYESAWKHNLFKHIDSKHLSEGHYCPICAKYCPSKNALQKHVKRNHSKLPFEWKTEKIHVAIPILCSFQLPLIPWWWRFLIPLAYHCGGALSVDMRQRRKPTSGPMSRPSTWAQGSIVNTVRSSARARMLSIPTCLDIICRAKNNLLI